MKVKRNALQGGCVSWVDEYAGIQPRDRVSADVVVRLAAKVKNRGRLMKVKKLTIDRRSMKVKKLTA